MHHLINSTTNMFSTFGEFLNYYNADNYYTTLIKYILVLSFYSYINTWRDQKLKTSVNTTKISCVTSNIWQIIHLYNPHSHLYCSLINACFLQMWPFKMEINRLFNSIKIYYQEALLQQRNNQTNTKFLTFCGKYIIRFLESQITSS